MNLVITKKDAFNSFVSSNSNNIYEHYMLSNIVEVMRKRQKRLFVPEVHPDSRRFKKAFNSALSFFDMDEQIATARMLNRNKLDNE
ncbi:MAG TPA: hypothetical protein VN922_19375 [Bacteroidia bacterium]|nr:hypothetical protein [Bacteroidia bacterium]